MAKSSSCKSFDVFEFKEEDELPEIAGRKLLQKFRNPSADSSPLLDYRFLELVSKGCSSGESKEAGDAPCFDVDAMDSDDSSENTFSDASMRGDAVRQSNCARDQQNLHLEGDDHRHGNVFSGPERSDSSNESLEVFTDAVEGLREISSTPDSDVAEDRDGQSSDERLSCSVEGYADEAVFFFPDYVIYRDQSCTTSFLAFSSCGIKLKFSIGDQKICLYQWGIDDVIRIESKWCGGVGTAEVKLFVLFKDLDQAESTDAISGIEELKFAITDPNWSEKREEVISLNVNYKALWNVELEVENGIQHNDSFQEHYFPSFDDPFEEVIYPEGDIDAVTISKRDVDLLEPDTFINDTIIDFYIKYLKNKLHLEENSRFHFFNSFFFRKLADLDKDPASASDRRASFQRVRKWTRKVNLFEKDYIFVPVNFSLHWSLIVICHPGEVTRFKEEDIDKPVDVPCILHMDSIKGSHAGLKDIIQSYLWEEWKEKQKETSEELSSKFLNMRFISLELPQQENSFDCGLFLLHYAECFLEDAPVHFNPFQVTKYSKFLTASWFPPDEVSLKRTVIQRLISKLLGNNSGENSAGCNNDLQAKFSGGKSENCVEYIGERCSPVTAHDNLLPTRDDQGIEMTLLSSSLRSSQCISDSGLVLRELFAPGATGQYQPFGQTFLHSGAISPITEEAEACQHFAYSPSGETGFQQLTGITCGVCPLTDPSGDFTGTSCNPEVSMVDGDHKSAALSPETRGCTSGDSIDIGFNKLTSAREDQSPSQIESAVLPESPSSGNIICSMEHLISGSRGLEVAQKCHDPDELLANANQESCPSYEDNLLASQPKEMGIACGIMHGIVSDHVLDPDVQQAAKRLRLTPPRQEEKTFEGTSQNDLHL